ncbi:hypothetical protein [Bacillus glycinifermentans]|uniref:Uncharacterized protein n=1 Tax=Bacillus glycinifermentans TaxID=1664069 RepID=A0A0T6BLY4_9BACI|nr:hypothetical protein [Bacillus glycinifermentans]ATH94737.1 hypothetical protein COP00_20895 [Bacillus glycinifermentans]KRT92021.1 hypothetical protein AB447_222775 [Bacillus glycinifermentans]MEC0486465.1 hypothetical protein [Bacillus glycinifermentans]
MGRVINSALYLPKGTAKDYIDEKQKMTRAEMQENIMQFKILYDFYCPECKTLLTIDKRGYFRVFSKTHQHLDHCSYGYEYVSMNYEIQQGKHTLLDKPKVVPSLPHTSNIQTESTTKAEKCNRDSHKIIRPKSKYSSRKKGSFLIRTVDEYFYHINDAKEKGRGQELYRVFSQEKISYSQKGYPFMYSNQIKGVLPDYFFVQGQINNRSNSDKNGKIQSATLKFYDHSNGRYIPKLFFENSKVKTQDILNSIKSCETIGILVKCKKAYTFESDSTTIHIIELEVYDIDIDRYS